MVVRGIVIFMFLVSSGLATATTYYVSSSAGSDANNGTSVSTSWRTIVHVNGQTFQPGDSILFKRGDVWNESLAPGSSGSAGNPITFDAYGAGAAPNLTGYYAVPPTAWVLVTGNAWKAAMPAAFTAVNFCLFGSVWGQKVAAGSSNLTAQWNFYLANGYIYVFSLGSPATFYNEPIVPMALSNVAVINVNGHSWLTFQHFLVNWFDQYGVYVQGASDHLVFANMEADSLIPQGTQPLGFYVNESAPGPGDIKIYNAEAHLNYDGFRFDGAATAITMVNDKAYGNRDGALVDNTGAVTYSYCHFYASSLAVAGSTDVEYTSGSGPMAGAGNVAQDTAPAVQAWKRYPAEVTLTVDDAGMTAGADTYYASTVLPIADAAGVPVGAAITVGYPLAQTLVAEFQGWVNAGRDVTSHSISHTYYTNVDALEIQYTGPGTAAVLNISNKTLTITVTGASDSVSYNLAQGQAQGTIKAVRLALLATGKFSATEVQTCQGPYGTGCSAYTEAALLAQDLADVSGQDVKSAVYPLQLDVTRLTTDEITLSRQWMTTNLTGLPATPVYVYPGGYETTTMQGITAGVPYAGARGALKQDLGVKDTYADGFNAQNITSFGVNPSWMGLQPAVLNQKVQALVWKESVWGVPWGMFWHWNASTGAGELSVTEITNLIQDFKASGATMQTNTGLVNWLLGGAQGTGADGNNYYKYPATSMTLDFRPTKNSPVVDAGQNLGAAYALDLNGVNQNSYGSGWEIGAHVYQGYAVYGESQAGSYFTLGGDEASAPNYSLARQDTNISQPVVANMGALTGAGTCAVPADFGYPICRLTDSTWDPSLASNTFTPVGDGARHEVNCGRSLAWLVSSGGQGYVGGLNYSSTAPYMSLAHVYPTNSSWSAHGGWYVGAQSALWSWNCAGTPSRLYVNLSASQTANSTEIQSFDFTGYAANPGGTPANAVVYNFVAGSTGSWGTTSANCLPTGYVPTWSELSGDSKNPADAFFAMALSGVQQINAGVDTISVTNGSTAFTISGATALSTSGNLTDAQIIIAGVTYAIATVAGGGMSGTLTTTYAGTTGSGLAMSIPADQGTGMDVVVYKVGSGCVHLNTGTGVLTGDFGATGTMTSPDRFYLHGARVTPDGTYLVMTTAKCVPGSSACNTTLGYIWTIGTTTVVPMCASPNDCGGHAVDGFTHIANNGASFPQLDTRLYGNSVTATRVIPTPPWPLSNCGVSVSLDTHLSWEDVDAADSYPVVISSTANGPSVQVPGSYNCPLLNEVYAVDPTRGTIYRFAHTLITGASWNYVALSGLGQVSDDGQYFMFGSDWNGTLGRYDLGSGSCVNSPAGASACRGDVFMVNLTAVPVF